MTAQSLLQTITSRGASIRVVGDRLRVKPDRVLLDADRAAIRALKPELLALLAADTHQVESGNSEKAREVSKADRLRFSAGKDFAAGHIDVDGLAQVLAEAEAMDGGDRTPIVESSEPAGSEFSEPDSKSRPRHPQGRRRVPPMPSIEALESDPYFLRARSRIFPCVAKGMKPDEITALAYRMARLSIGLPVEDVVADSHNGNLGESKATNDNRDQEYAEVNL